MEVGLEPSVRARPRSRAEKMAPPPPEDKLKVLCLHGFTQNAEAFRARTGSVRKNLKSRIEFVFLDGPHSAEGAFPDADRASLGSADAPAGANDVGPRAWWLVGENAAPSAPAPPGEWVRPALSRQMRGWDETAERIRTACRTHGPFRGILGFSQGACTAALALTRIPELAETIEFAVLIGGFEPMDPSAADDLAPAPDGSPRCGSVRSLHVHGRADRMVSRDRVLKLMGAFKDPELFEHEGGHGVPSSKPFRDRLKAFALEECRTAGEAERER